jgi:tripartite-type tricarboxylate transporter receptor subunit TctC
MGDWLSQRLGQQIIIENKPGAATNIATQAVIASPPDGYTLLWVGISNVLNASIYANIPFNFLRDIAPVAGMVIYPLVIEVHPSVPAKTIPDLIALAKANPGQITMASYGTGTISHVAGELFKSKAGINMVHVPYRGGPAMATDLMGGQVQVAIDTMAGSLPHIRSGKVRALAVMTSARSDALPDVPTVAETIPEFEVQAFAGIGVPSGTPEAIINRLNQEVNAGLRNAAVKTRLSELMVVPLILTPAEFGAYLIAETEKWAGVIQAANIKPE